MQMTRQIEALRQTVAAPWGPGVPDRPCGHWARIAVSLLQPVRPEVVELMTRLQLQQKASAATHTMLGELTQRFLWRCCPGVVASRWRALPPVPWEVDGHNSKRDRAECNKEQHNFFDAYCKEEETSTLAPEEEICTHKLPPLSVLWRMEFPGPVQADQPHLPQYHPTLANPPSPVSCLWRGGRRTP
jgi:hypothetical protein